MAFVKKLVAALVKYDFETYIGHKGDIFFNLDTGEFRVSDGETPGGVPTSIAPIATDEILGVVKQGAGIFIDEDGTISVDVTSLPSGAPASGDTAGTVIIGDNINVDQDGRISIPLATTATAGVVKVGSNVSISGDGTISVATGAGINRVIDIPDVYSVNLAEGQTLVYNAAANRWETTEAAESVTDGGFF
jgi:hypothetical protein